MSLDSVSAYLRVPQKRRGMFLLRSEWDVPPQKQLDKERMLSRLRRGTVDKPKILPVPEPEPVENTEQAIWEYHDPAPYEKPSDHPARDKMMALISKITQPPEERYSFVAEDLPVWKRICLETCNKHNVAFNELISPRRDKKLVRARYEVMWRMKKETSMSFPAIGRRLGGRDHSTIIVGVRRYEEIMRDESERGDFVS